MRFAYGYTMIEASDRVRAIAPEHAAYWRAAALPGYLGGPFADRRGGLITFDAASSETAEQLAADDPFRREMLVGDYWLREWRVE